MKKLILLLLLALPFISWSQEDRFQSSERVFTSSKKDGTSVLKQSFDTCNIVIRREQDKVIVYALGVGVSERAVLDSFLEQHYTKNGLTIVTHLYNHWTGIIKIAFTYKQGILLQLDFIAPTSVHSFTIIPIIKLI